MSTYNTHGLLHKGMCTGHFSLAALINVWCGCERVSVLTIIGLPRADKKKIKGHFQDFPGPFASIFKDLFKQCQAYKALLNGHR